MNQILSQSSWWRHQILWLSGRPAGRLRCSEGTEKLDFDLRVTLHFKHDKPISEGRPTYLLTVSGDSNSISCPLPLELSGPAVCKLFFLVFTYFLKSKHPNTHFIVVCATEFYILCNTVSYCPAMTESSDGNVVFHRHAHRDFRLYVATLSNFLWFLGNMLGNQFPPSLVLDDDFNCFFQLFALSLLLWMLNNLSAFNFFQTRNWCLISKACRYFARN